MAIERINNELWFRENLFSDVAQLIKISKILAKRKTKDSKGKFLQDLLILDTYRFGKMLVLDNVVQFTEADEKYYQEPLVHCALFSHPNPKNVLVIGGGDGGVLREILKHAVKLIDLVDIDKDVIDLVKKYIPEMAKDCWNDPRLKVHVQDGAVFVKKTKKKFDVIIIDSPDPIGPAESLFKTSFYLDCKRILSSSGVIIRQTGSSVFQPEEMPSSFRQMEEIFPEVQTFLSSVATYIGGYFSFVAASIKQGAFEKSLSRIQKRFDQLKLKTEWYTPNMHKASMVLPRELAESLKKTEYGIELVVDLYNCNYETITSRAKLRQFASEICKVIKMKPYGEPLIPDFGFSLAKTAGPSMVQLIESSSITAHYSPHWRLVCLNIFTCKTFDPEKAFKFAREFFGAERSVAYLIKRGGKIFSKDFEIIKVNLK